MKDFHPVAALFPLMPEPELLELAADIGRNGLIEPIWLHPDGRILDGRNRYRACERAGVRPTFREWSGEGSAVAFVWSLNGPRRHLTPSQKAVIALDILPLLEQEAKERMAVGAQGREKIPYPETGKASEHAAAIVQVNPRYVSDAKAIAKEAPDLTPKIRDGSLSITEANRQRKERKREARRETNREIVAAVPDPIAVGARFATIVIDPPWDWGDEGDCDQMGRARPTYATMSIGDLAKLPVGAMADVDCHLYLWITNRSLPKGFGLLEAWGFRYVTCLTWVKPSFGMGNYFRGQTEQVLFGVRGSQPLRRKDVGTAFSAPRGPRGHSSKPAEFSELVESCSPGPYLEMFSRSDRAGWTHWGESS